MDSVEVKQEPGSWPLLNCLEVKQETAVEIGFEDIFDGDNDSDHTNDPFNTLSDNSNCDDKSLDKSEDDPFEDEEEYQPNHDKKPSEVDKSKAPQETAETLILNGQVVNNPSTGVTKFDFTTLAENKLSCNHCDFVSTNRRYLYKHITGRHMNKKTYKQCPHCDFKTLNGLRDHLIVRHTEDHKIEWYRCDKCDFKSKTRVNYFYHLRTGHISAEEKLKRMKKCEKCPKTFANPYRLRRHMLASHDQRRQCEVCGHVADHHVTLLNHLKQVHADDKDLKILKCDECDYETKFSYLFRTHRTNCKARSVRKRGLGIQCEKCPHQSNSMAAMKLHSIFHKEVKNDTDLKYRCDKCDYKTYRWYSLEVHKLNHLKPAEIQYFYCYHCDFKAKRKDNLKTHIRNHFKKKTELVCYICDFKTFNKVSHIAHLGKHSKEQKEEQRMLNEDQEKRKRQRSSGKKKKAPLNRRKAVKNDEDEPENPEKNDSVPNVGRITRSGRRLTEQNKKLESEASHDVEKEKLKGQSSSDNEKETSLTRRKTGKNEAEEPVNPEKNESLPLESKFVKDWLNTDKKNDHDDVKQNETKGTDESVS